MTAGLADLGTLSRLLDVAMDLDPGGLDSWLATLPEEDRRLGGLVREMLEKRLAHHGADSLTGGPRLASPISDDSEARAGDHVGPYRLIRELGHGGMGTVWLAERSDGSLKRQVALKLPRLAWGAGLSERMGRERDIAALLEHPHIARLYDAGIDERGRPYLALEYVDGQPLDAWCRNRALSVRDRLLLFLQVANAVAYAHGRLVVHRDLKPSNVLITADGHAHLMDFGIAKLITDVAVASDDMTREHGLMLTPSNASPEQLCGGAITVASDIYSLGVLLYDVLTGTHPYVVKRNTAAAFEEAILEGEPLLASQRAVDATAGRQLRGDIDAILCKALKRDPAERYATVDAMAADIERHLNGEPVGARPYRWGYRLIKGVRRHRLAVTATALVVLAMVGGASKSLIEARRADAEAERARLVKEFVVDIFNTRAGPDGAMAQMPGLALLERSARTIDSKFASQPLLRAELYGVVSTMFFNIANLSQALVYAKRQVETLIAANASDRQIARASLALSDIYIPMERDREAMDSAQLALDRAGGNKGIEARAHASKAVALLFGTADVEQAEPELDAAEAALRASTASASDRAAAAWARGIWFGFRKLPDAARAQFDDAIALGRAADGADSTIALNSRMEAAKTLLLADHFEAGKSYLDAGVATMRAAGGPDDARAALWESYGATWMYRGDAISFAEATQIFDRSIATLRSQKWSVPRSDIDAIERQKGVAYLRWGNIERGFALAVQGREETDPGADALGRWWHDLEIVRALTQTDRASEAVPIARRLLPARDDQPNYDLRISYKALALAFLHVRRYSDAEAVLADFDRVAATRKPQGPETQASMTLEEVRILVALELGKSIDVLHMTAALLQHETVHRDEVAWLSRAAALCTTGSADEGRALFAKWLPRLANDRYDASPHLAYWRARAGLCALARGHRAEAAEAADLAASAIALQPRVSAHYKAAVDSLKQRLARG